MYGSALFFALNKLHWAEEVSFILGIGNLMYVHRTFVSLAGPSGPPYLGRCFEMYMGRRHVV